MTNKKNLQKVKLTLSVELDIRANTKEEINSFVNNYVSCLGDKDIKIEKVEVNKK